MYTIATKIAHPIVGIHTHASSAFKQTGIKCHICRKTVRRNVGLARPIKYESNKESYKKGPKCNVNLNKFHESVRKTFLLSKQNKLGNELTIFKQIGNNIENMSVQPTNEMTDQLNSFPNYDLVTCKKVKLNFIRFSDLSKYKNILEFRTLMFEKQIEVNPPITYIDSGSQEEIKPDFKWEMLKSKLEFYGYHDLEIIKGPKFGLKYSKCREVSGRSLFDQGMCYKHSDPTKVLLYFQSNNLPNPYSRLQLINLIIIIKFFENILLIFKKDKHIRYIIDHRSKRFKYETLNKYPFKTRLPSLREFVIYLPVFKIKSASIVDFKHYYRQLPVNNYNYNSNILTREPNEKSCFIDTYGQMGQIFFPVMAQRLNSSLNYIYNNECVSRASSLGYQDDTVIFYFSGCPFENTDVFIKLCANFGIEINKAKTIISKTRIVWLDVTFDFEKKIIFPSERRTQSINKWLITFEENKYATLREIHTVRRKN